MRQGKAELCVLELTLVFHNLPSLGPMYVVVCVSTSMTTVVEFHRDAGEIQCIFTPY